MNFLSRYFQLSSEEKWLFWRALQTVLTVRLGLMFFSLPALRQIIAVDRRPMLAGPPNPAALKRTVWAVKAVSHRVPGATCLTQALAAQKLLALQRIPVELCIGVAKSVNGILEAHAWLERDGKVLIGRSPDFQRFASRLNLKNGQL